MIFWSWFSILYLIIRVKSIVRQKDGDFFRRWTGTLRTGSQVLSGERNGHVCWRSSVRDSELCPRPRACPMLATRFVYSSLYEVLEALAWMFYLVHLLLLQIILINSHLKLQNLLVCFNQLRSSLSFLFSLLYKIRSSEYEFIYMKLNAGHRVLLSTGVFISARRPRGTICKNKGYVSGWTRIPQEGPFYIKCCSCEFGLILSQYYCMHKSLHNKNVSHILNDYCGWIWIEFLYSTFLCSYNFSLPIPLVNIPL